MEIYTKRLRLRPFAPHDLDQLYHLWTDQTVRQYFWDGETIPKIEAERAMTATISSWAEFGFGQWIILLKGQEQFIGSAGFLMSNHPFFDREVLAEDQGLVELIFAILPHYRGCGYATEAVQAALEFGFNVAHFGRVVAIADTPNVASIRVLEEVGMIREGGVIIGGQEIVMFRFELIGQANVQPLRRRGPPARRRWRPPPPPAD